MDELFARLVSAFPDVARIPRARVRDVVRRLAVASLRPAGYSVRRDVLTTAGEPTKPALKQADYLLGMPRVQAALDAKFNAAGLTVERQAEIMAEIALGTKRVREQVAVKGEDGIEIVELERDVAPADRLKALDMRFRLTTGYAPTKAQNVNANVPVDAFFDERTYQDTPPIATSTQGPKNVTPPAARKKR